MAPTQGMRASQPAATGEMFLVSLEQVSLYCLTALTAQSVQTGSLPILPMQEAQKLFLQIWHSATAPISG